MKRIANLVCAILYFAFLTVPNLAKAESADSGILYLACLPNGVLKLISPIGMRTDYNSDLDRRFAKEIDGDNLLRFNDNTHSKNVPGNKVIERTCGPLSIKISLGFFDGSGGDTTPVVTVFKENKILVDELKLGYCDASLQSDCPDKWASRIIVSAINPQEVTFITTHDYSVSKTIPNKN